MVRRRESLRLDWLTGNVRDLRMRYERACRIIPSGAHEWRMVDAGDRRIAAKLIRRAKIRNRPLIWHIRRYSQWLLALAVGIYLAKLLLILSSHPSPRYAWSGCTQTHLSPWPRTGTSSSSADTRCRDFCGISTNQTRA